MIKQCRRVATRYDKLAANYLAFVKLASIRIWLRANESTPRSLIGRLGRAQRNPTPSQNVEMGIASLHPSYGSRHPTGKSVVATKSCPAPSKKIFRFRRRANQFYQLAPSFPGKRGASRSSRTRDGMRWTRQRWRAGLFAGRSSVSEQQRADERRFNAFAKAWRTAHGPRRILAEVAAYGEVVWSWHPLLMPSLAEVTSSQPGLTRPQSAWRR